MTFILGPLGSKENVLSMTTKTPASGVALALACLVLLGTLPIISANRSDEASALLFAFFLSFWELVSSLPAIARERAVARSAQPGTDDHGTNLGRRARTLVVLTGVIFGASTYMYVHGVEKAGSISFAIALQAYPLFAILWETIFLGRKKRPQELLLTLLMLGALYFLGTNGTWMISGFSIWFLFSLGVPFLWSVAHVILREVLVTTRVTANQVVFSRLIISTVFLGLVLLVSEGPTAVIRSAVDSEVQTFAIFMGIVYYLELFCWFRAVKQIDVSLASSITTPSPVITMLFAVLFLGDSVETYQVVAMAVVVASVFGIVRAGHRG